MSTPVCYFFLQVAQNFHQKVGIVCHIVSVCCPFVEVALFIIEQNRVGAGRAVRLGNTIGNNMDFVPLNAGEMLCQPVALDFGNFGIKLICSALGQPANNADIVATSLQAVQIAGEGGEVNKRASVRIYACVRGLQL